MKKPVSKKTEATAEVQRLDTTTITYYVWGTRPLIMNRLNEKARQELLLPAARKNQAERASSLKHDPVLEFRSSMYRRLGNDHPTRVVMPGGAFSQALASAALDIPGAAKAQIARLTEVVDFNVGIYGIPYLLMAIVRQSDINRTPDVRTRAIFKEWCAIVNVRFVRNLLTERTVSNLFGGAGMIVGIGDWRRQKGGPYGQFDLVGKDDERIKTLIANAGLVQQDEAIEAAEAADEDTDELYAWFQTEAARREKTVTHALAA